MWHYTPFWSPAAWGNDNFSFVRHKFIRTLGPYCLLCAWTSQEVAVQACQRSTTDGLPDKWWEVQWAAACFHQTPLDLTECSIQLLFFFFVFSFLHDFIAAHHQREKKHESCYQTLLLKFSSYWFNPALCIKYKELFFLFQNVESKVWGFFICLKYPSSYSNVFTLSRCHFGALRDARVRLLQLQLGEGSHQPQWDWTLPLWREGQAAALLLHMEEHLRHRVDRQAGLLAGRCQLLRQVDMDEWRNENLWRG